MSDTNRVAGDELRQFCERIERLEAEKQYAAECQKEVYAESKGRGYDTAVLRKVIARRKRDRDDLANETATLEMYEDALGARPMPRGDYAELVKMRENGGAN